MEAQKTDKMVAPGVSTRDVLHAISEPAARRFAYQPIVDLRHGTVTGYEALARFAGRPEAAPDAWFRAAAAGGLATPLDAALLASILEARPVSDGPFLSLNVNPNSLAAPSVVEVLDRVDDLSGVVFELTEHIAVIDTAALRASLESIAAKGGRLAIDDTGSGYSGLQQLLMLRPSFIKLDRSLVVGLHQDPAKAALVEMLGGFAARIDAAIVAEGIERVEELEALIGLGIPLGQGYLLGRPEDEPTRIGELVAIHIRNLARAHPAGIEALEALMERAPVLGPDSVIEHASRQFRLDPQVAHVVVVDSEDRPLALLLRPDEADDEPRWRGLQTMNSATSLVDAARRALTRPSSIRFDPLVCTDENGCYVGLVRLERVVSSLAAVIAKEEGTKEGGGDEGVLVW